MHGENMFYLYMIKEHAQENKVAAGSDINWHWYRGNGSTLLAFWCKLIIHFIIDSMIHSTHTIY